MTCGCLHKRGSGGTFLSGVTWKGYPKGMIVRKTGKGMRFSGTGAFRKPRRKKKMTGSGFRQRVAQTRRWAGMSPAIRAGLSMGNAQDRMMAARAARLGITVNGGSGIHRKRRKKKGGMSMTGGGVNFSGGAMINDAMRVVLNRVRLNRFRRP